MKAIELLKSHNISITNTRLDLLSELLKAKKPLSLENIKTKANKTTIYRTIELFLNAGICKKIELDGKGFYVISEQACAFFVCESCHKAEQIELPEINKHVSSVLVKGVCERCEDEDE